MRRALAPIALLAATLSLGACIDDYGGGYGGVYSAGAYYPYGGYYDAYPGGYYRGDGYYRGGYVRDRGYRPPPARPAPRPNWRDGRPREDGAARRNWNQRNDHWSRNPAGSGNAGRSNGRR